MTETATTERPEQLDEVLVVLQRIHPGEMEQPELEEETGLDVNALGDCIRWMQEHGELDTDAEHYRWRDPSEEAAAPAGSPSPEPSEQELDPDAGGDPTADEEIEAPVGAHVRAGMRVSVSFARKPAESDQAAARKVQSVSEEVRKALTKALPKLNVEVEVESVDAFDSRRIWPPETSEDE